MIPLTMTRAKWFLYAYARREHGQTLPEGALSDDAVALYDEANALRSRLITLKDCLLCPETNGGRHEWRAGQWAGADERPIWCCQCGQDAADIVDHSVRAAATPSQDAKG